jgi:hypothetical protein
MNSVYPLRSCVAIALAMACAPAVGRGLGEPKEFASASRRVAPDPAMHRPQQDSHAAGRQASRDWSGSTIRTVPPSFIYRRVTCTYHESHGWLTLMPCARFSGNRKRSYRLLGSADRGSIRRSRTHSSLRPSAAAARDRLCTRKSTGRRRPAWSRVSRHHTPGTSGLIRAPASLQT